jgi:hypothetical protein
MNTLQIIWCAAFVLFFANLISIDAGILGRKKGSNADGFDARLAKLEANGVSDDEKEKLAASLDSLVSLVKKILLRQTRTPSRPESLENR